MNKLLRQFKIEYNINVLINSSNLIGILLEFQ